MPDSKVRRFRFEGVEYSFDPQAITGRMERELWKAAGVSPVQAFEALAAGASFGFAAVLWLSRVQRGDKVTYEQVEKYLDEMDRDEVDLEFLPEVEADEVPQLSGADSNGSPPSLRTGSGSSHGNSRTSRTAKLKS